MSRSTWVIIAVGVVVILGLCVVMGWFLVNWQYQESGLAEFRRIENGMVREQVLSILGNPYIGYTAGHAPHDYYVSGYGHPQRQITGEVLIYISGEYIAYIYLDRQGKVEEVSIHGS